MWSREDIAWMAGLVEGEGCILLPSKNISLTLKITMCDEDVIVAFKERAQVGYVGGPWKPYGLGKKPRYGYAAKGKDAYALIVAMYPWLQERRRQRAKEAIQKWLLISPYRLLTPMQVYEIREKLGERKRYGRYELTQKAIAEEYGVALSTINHIRNNRNWSQL